MQARIRWLSPFIALLFAAMLPSCKSPTTPTQPAANPLSITVPDSARVFDTVTFRAHYADSTKPSWKYEWLFGDSTKASTTDTSITHVYDSAGTYSVQVTLADTTSGQTIAKQTGLLSIVARHFNLALLQTMPYVDFTWQARADTSYSAQWFTANPCGSPPTIKPLTWSGTNFSMGSSYSGSHQSSPQPGYGEWDTESGSDTLNGMVDISSSQLITFSQNDNYAKQELDSEDYMIAGGCYTPIDATSYSAIAVPFLSESDSDVVFEANGDLAKNAFFKYNIQAYGRFTSAQNFSITANFADATVNRYVIIRFHK